MPVANSAASAVNGSLPKWQLALAVGAPVALGLGYMYYRNSSQDKSAKGGKTNRSKNKQISIEAADSPDKNATETIETPAAKAQRYKGLGNQAFMVRKYDDAILWYNKAIETCPVEDKEELAKNYQNRAAAYEGLEKFSAVKEDCTKALELNPKYIKALIRRAKVLEKLNELELALEDVTIACVLEKFSNQSSLVTADRVLKQLGKQHAHELLNVKEPVMPSNHFIRAYFKTFRKDPVLSDHAIESLSMDENKELWRIINAFKNDEFDEIIPICNEQIDKFEDDNLPEKMKFLLLRGTFQLLLGQHDKAMDDLGAVITNASTEKLVRINALIKRATMHMQLENPTMCFKDFEAAVHTDADCGDIYYHRAQVNVLLERISDAKEDSDKSLKLNPDFGMAYAQKCYTDYRQASMNRSSNLLETAMENFEKAFERFPDCCECYTLYAQMLCDSELYEKADEYFVKAIEKDPTDAAIYVHRGLLQLQWTANIPKAIEYINTALKLDAKCELGYETLGTIEVQRGNLKEAIKLFDKALPLARTALELAHIFSLQDAAKAQMRIVERLGADFSYGPQRIM